MPPFSKNKNKKEFNPRKTSRLRDTLQRHQTARIETQPPPPSYASGGGGSSELPPTVLPAVDKTEVKEHVIKIMSVSGSVR